MKGLLILLILAVSHAYMVPADLKGDQDTGAASLPSLRATLIIDCNNSTVISFVSDNKTGNSVSGATLFVFRTDSGYSILNRSQTDAEGRGDLRIPGKMAYLNDLYVLRIEKSGFRSKELQFTFWNCDEVKREYSEYSQPEANHSEPEPAAPLKEDAAASKIQEMPGIGPKPIAIAGETENPAPPQEEPPGMCMGAFLILLAFLRQAP